mgnify:CR=1 FL=1
MSETDNIFVYRDAKQFTGLSHCQARDNHNLDFAYNASFAAVNVAKSLRRDLDSSLSIGRMKSLLGSMKYFWGGLHKFGQVFHKFGQMQAAVCHNFVFRTLSFCVHFLPEYYHSEYYLQVL